MVIMSKGTSWLEDWMSNLCTSNDQCFRLWGETVKLSRTYLLTVTPGWVTLINTRSSPNVAAEVSLSKTNVPFCSRLCWRPLWKAQVNLDHLRVFSANFQDGCCTFGFKWPSELQLLLLKLPFIISIIISFDNPQNIVWTVFHWNSVNWMRTWIQTFDLYYTSFDQIPS